MPAGFEVYDVNGKLQASSELYSHWLRTSGNGTSSQRQGGNTTPSSLILPQLTTGFVNPLIAINCAYGVALLGVNYSGYPNFACAGPVGTFYEYFIFDQSTTLPTSSIGLELRNAAGQLTFSSNQRPMQALALLTTDPLDPTVEVSATFPGRKMAVGCNFTGGHRTAGQIDYYASGQPVIDSGGIVPNWDQTGYRNYADLYGGVVSNGNQTISTATVSFDNVYIGPVNGLIVQDPDWFKQARVFAIDVTNVPILAAGVNFF